MGLEKEKEEIQEKKRNEGGKRLNQEEVQNIAVAVKSLIDQDKEKQDVTKQLTGVTKEVGNLKGELGKIQQGMYCSPDGKYCFHTPEALQNFMTKQAEQMKAVKEKLTEVVEKVSNMKPPKTELPGGLEPLENMTEEKRKTFTEEENKLRDGQVDKIEDFFRVSDNDRWRRLRKTEVNLDIISGKPEMISRVLKAIPSMPQDQKGKIIQVVCTDKSCRVQLEKEQGTRIYKQDDRGKWKWLDEPEKEGPHI